MNGNKSQDKIAETKRSVLELLDSLSSRDRMEFIEGLYTADLTGQQILDMGSKAMRLKEIPVGKIFVCMPCPEDGQGNGGLRNDLLVFKKVKDTASARAMDLHELSNVMRLKDGSLFTLHPQTWVLNIVP